MNSRWLAKEKKSDFEVVVGFKVIASNSTRAIKIINDSLLRIGILNEDYSICNSDGYDIKEIQLKREGKTINRAVVHKCRKCKRLSLDRGGKKCKMCGAKYE